MSPADFQKEVLKINNKLGPKLNKIIKWAKAGNSICQGIMHTHDRWMDSRDIGDLNILISLIDKFEQAEREKKL